MIDQSENLTFFGCLRSTLLDANGRHLGFTFLIDRMTDVLGPDIYIELTGRSSLIRVCACSNWIHFFS
jgi:hypothetical protein